MADYIEREKVYEMLNALGGCGAETESWADGWDKAIDTAIDALSEIAAADVRPERHGRWSDKMVAVPQSGKAGYHEDDFSFGFQCSECGDVLNKTRYCGSCGAKMDGKDTNNEHSTYNAETS